MAESTDSRSLRPSLELHYHSTALASPSSLQSDTYKKYEKRGLAIIFNHKYYDLKIPIRYGTNKDRDDLTEVLTYLKFDVSVYNDLSRSEITEVLSRVKNIDHSESDCLLVVVMSHGEDGKFYARDEAYPIKKLWEAFFNVSTLVGKPKLFFVQACRGNKFDPGVTLSCDEFDGLNKKLYSMPVTADILVMYSTFEGYYSYRDPQKGSYFIQSLVHHLKKAEGRNLLSVLTDVNREVAISYYDKEMCTIVSTLTRHFSL